MATHPPDVVPFSAEVVEVKGQCSAGHKVGDRLTLSCWDSGGLCGFFYHDIFPSLSVMQFGGKYPWAQADRMIFECPDRKNVVILRVRKM
jgi:uncharacterized repeat protein (TIGR04076 family)